MARQIDFFFRNRVVVVTGASSGVGRAAAITLGRYGAKVALLARSERALRNAAREVEDAGGSALALPLDVADYEAVQRATTKVVDTWGTLDVWINNAMVTVFSPVMKMHPEEYKRVTEVNYLGTVHGTLAALNVMTNNNAGTIVQVGSALAYRSIPLQSAYCASKAAIRAFTDSLRSELIHDKSRIKLCMVQLPAINTPQFLVGRNRMPRMPQPVPPIFPPQLAADAILHAAANGDRELMVAGSTVEAVIAQRLAPRFADRLLAKRGYRGQMSDKPAQNGPDNLFSPPPFDPGVEGPYGEKTRSTSLEWELRRRVPEARDAINLRGLPYREHSHTTE